MHGHTGRIHAVLHGHAGLVLRRAEMGHTWWTLISIIIVLVGVYILYREYKHGSGE